MSNSNTLKLYRASAGSGKTYTLSLEFLKLLVCKPDSYKNILAVTFTNKATAEMQTRIMSDLYTITNNLDASLLANLMKGLEADRLPSDPLLSEDDVRKNARLALNKILHDYSRFQISTIDSFFQIILRNLAHELGVGAYLNISIDQDEPLTDAVDVLTEECNTNKDIRQKLIDFIKEKSDNGKNTNIASDIKKFSQNIFKEDFKQFEEAIEKILKDNPKAIEDYRNSIRTLKNLKIKEIEDIISEFDSYLQGKIKKDDLKSGVYGYIKEIKEGKYTINIADKKNSYKGIENEELDAWATVKSPFRNEIRELAENQLIPIGKKLVKKVEENKEDIISCNLILEKVNEFGLLYEMSEIVRKVNNERGQFILSDTANLLQGMIQDSDTPFIYEKIGTKLDHIMIDEFQDTSQTQWNNFRPLINECLASNQTNLIVGDAKQAIYRFRNSDWQIIQDLDNEPSFKRIGVSPTLIPASGNYRSMQEIIDFNNMLFAPKDAENDISPILQPYINVFFNGEGATASSKELFKKLVNVYRTAHQDLGKKEKQEQKGFVLVEFLGDGQDKKGNNSDTDEEEKNDPSKDNRMLNHLLKTVIDLQLNKDIQAKDINILVRNSKRISQIAEFFANYKNLHSSELSSSLKLDIISDEAYLLESSIALTTLIDAMRVILNPDDLISMTEVYFRYNSIKDEKSELQDAISQTIADTGFMYSEDFKRFKGEILECSSLPLYEMTERLIHLLQLEKMKNQSSFIFKFLDALNEFIQRKTSDLAHFIDYWDKYLKQQKIPMGNNADGIRISTIHKSKGLEYHTVIIPFCNDPYTNGNSEEEIAWCKIPTENKSFSGFPVWPINIKSKKVKYSIFKDDWSRNQVLTLADSINLLYVAFTRAVCNLFIMCDNVVPKKDKGKQTDEENKVPKHFNTLLLNVLEDKLSDVEEEETTENEEQKVVFRYYQKGTIMSSFSPEEKKKSSNPFKADADTIDCHFHHERLRANFRNSNKASDCIKNLLDAENCTEENNKTRVKAQKKGVLLHALFSKINTENDIEKATEELLSSGMIESKEEKDELMDYAKEKIKEHNEDWFRPGLKTFNECSILSLDPNTKKLSEHRPDRVIQEGKKMIIIDYKTGKYHEEHQKQVDQYATLLQQMGYETETHLWYLNETTNTKTVQTS